MFFLIKVANWENLKLCRKINSNASVCQLICLPFKNNFLSKENFKIRVKVYCSSFAAVATGTFNWPIIDLSWDKGELLEWTWHFSIRVARHCIVRNRHLSGEITFWLHKGPYSFFGLAFGIRVSQKQGTSEDQQDLKSEVKKIPALINDWENNIACGKNLSKTRPWLLASAIRFIL